MPDIELQNLEKGPIHQFDERETEEYYHQRNVFTLEPTELSRPPTPNVEVQAEDRSYWLKQVRFVCIPFLIIGFPVHLLFRDKSIKYPWPATLISSYLYPRTILFQTALLIAIPLFIAGYLSYNAWRTLYYLLIVGGLKWDLFVHVANLMRTLPAAVPLYFCWYRGPCITEFINSFDSLRWDLFNSLKSFTLRNRPVMHPRPPGNRYLKKICTIYFVITISHIIPMILDTWVRRTAISFWITSMYSYMLPLYCTLCWAVFEEYKTLSRYLKSLLVNDGVGPTLENLARIKTWYRKIGRHVIYINHTIGYYMCWVLPSMMFAISLHIALLMTYFMGYTSLQAFFSFQELLLENEIAEGGSAQSLFRKSVAHTFVAILQLLLVAYTVKQAVDVNDEARFTHILLNEYLSDHSTWIIKNDDLYKAFGVGDCYAICDAETMTHLKILRGVRDCLIISTQFATFEMSFCEYRSRHLKTYMYVTHEKHNPAFMKLLVVEYCPIVAGRLHKQNLRDVIAHGRFLQEVV